MSHSKMSAEGSAELSHGEVAELLDAVGTTKTAGESGEILRRCIERDPELGELWRRLARPTSAEITGLEMVKAVLTAEMDAAWPEGERVARRLIHRIEGGAERLAELDRMAEVLGGRRAGEGWVEGVLEIYQEADRLVESRGWNDPREVLDPTGELGLDAERLSKVCLARLQNAPGSNAEKKRLLWVLARLSEHASKKGPH